MPFITKIILILIALAILILFPIVIPFAIYMLLSMGFEGKNFGKFNVTDAARH